MAAPHSCFVCQTPGTDPFLVLRDVPTHANLLATSRGQARAVPRADIELVLCRSCGLLFNRAFDPELMTYVEGYETSLFASPTFRAYADAEAQRLFDDFKLSGKVALEIGCGSGEFLRLLCDLGLGRGIGLDPSHAGLSEAFANGAKLEIQAEPYQSAWPNHLADIVLSRHVLEHLHEPLELLRTVREALDAQPGSSASFEVPNGHFTLRQGGIWDVIYEHCSYFTSTSLAGAFELAELAPKRVESTFGGQFLTIDADAGPVTRRNRASELVELIQLTEVLGSVQREKLASWETLLADLRAKGEHAALWGAGSKGVSFLNALDPTGEIIPTVVDLNPAKQGRFLPGTGQEIVSPEALQANPPALVIVMNPVYDIEIGRHLNELGLSPERRTA